AQTGMTFQAALGVGVLPFIVVDLCKIVAAAFLGPLIKARINF
ncbi:MAG: biotin transporter BioY, partial [Lachnospiraceae bacterium]|nr:biotin transporter BioY [Lachnospiraceae bacterium]